MNLGVVLADEDRLEEALAALRLAARLRPNDPLALSNLGTVLHRSGDWEASAQAYRHALAIRPELPNLHYNLGNAYLDAAIQGDLSLLNHAVHEYTECLSADAAYPGALNNLGNALKEQDRFLPAVRAWTGALRLEGGMQADVVANLVHLRLFLCDWGSWDRRHARLAALLREQLARPGANKTVSCQPFHALLYPPFPPELALDVARSFAAAATASVRHFAPLQLDAGVWRVKARGRLRVGYLSHDLGDHPTGHLLAAVPGLHAAGGQVDPFLFSLGPSHDLPASTPYLARLAASVPPGRLYHVAHMPFHEAASTINQHHLHVLIDLDVWMKGRRPEILAMRPAAMQVVYLGFPGSSGAAYMDFMVSDRVVTPPEASKWYSESFIMLPGSYQVNDCARAFANARADAADSDRLREAMRRDEGLPDRDLLIGNFNQLYKIDPSMLDSWARVLRLSRTSRRRVRLWLLRFPAEAAARLVKEAAARGLGEGDVVWSARLGKDDHMRRVRKN